METKANAQQQSAQAQTQSQEIVKYDNISDQVLARVNSFEQEGGINLPKNYSVSNSLKSAWLILQDVEDREHHKALSVCTKSSIANALFDMVLQGLSVSKNQGYFIVYGNKLDFQRSYFGTVALAKRAGGIKTEPVANVIYEGDEFVYTIDPKTGLMSVIKHEQTLENINDAKIKAAYAIVTLANGQTQTTIMTIQQIHSAWNQGATKGNSPAHKNFPAEMCKKTVIGRACKMIINSSDDAWLYDGKKDEFDTDVTQQQRNEEISQKGNKTAIDLENADYEEVSSSPATEQAQTAAPAAEPQQEAASAPVEEDGPGY